MVRGHQTVRLRTPRRSRSTWEALAHALSSQSIDPLPTDGRQTEEVLLTAAQSLLAVVLLINLRMSTIEGGVLAVLFFAQLLTPHSVVSRDMFSIMYITLAILFGGVLQS